MVSSFSRLKPAAILLVFFLTLIPLNAQSFWDDFHWAILGNMNYFAADNGVNSDNVTLIPSLGVSFAWQFWGPLRVEFTEDIYFANYDWHYERGYPMACGPENRSAFVLGFLTGLQLTGAFPLGDNGILARAYVGPAADLRIIALAFGLNHAADFTGDLRTDPQLQTNAISKYYWSNGRWFMPVAGLGMDFPLNKKFLLGFDLRTWFPVYKLWNDDDTPAIDGWRFGASFRITPRAISN